MSTTTPDPRIDRLYKLLPAIYRMRDAEQGYPLQALLRVMAEQVNVMEDDIAQLYENWFIETADEWAVPYIADLIGYRPVSDTGPASDASTAEKRALNRVLIPRREVANTIRYRRRKGTLALLELLANDVAGWPARAVEFFKLLGWNQNINHPHVHRARTANLRRVEDLDWINGPFDPLAHTVDVRRINSPRALGRYNIPSVGVFVWRLKPYSVTQSPAYCKEAVGENCFTFSVLHYDAPLFIKPEPETEPTHIAEELNLPAPIRRLAFSKDKERFYGPERSLAIWVEGWAGCDFQQPVPVSAILPADLSGWQYGPPLGHIAVDPVLGRFAFHPDQLPEKRSVRVTYHYAFSADMGGGEYERAILDPQARQPPDPNDPSKQTGQTIEPTVYRVGSGRPFHHIRDVLDDWKKKKPLDAVIELTDNSVYTEPISITLDEDQTLQIRAANRARPVLRLLDWELEAADALSVSMNRGSRFTLDGLLVCGRGVRIHGPKIEKPGDPRAPICGAAVVIRHCTLVPEWGFHLDREGKGPISAPSLELRDIRAGVRIERSILGSIQIHENEVRTDPIPVRITDSILDATGARKQAMGAKPGAGAAFAVLTIQRCTVFGIVDVHAVELAENCIFNDCLHVARRQLGCMRFCYVPYGCRTPRRYHCQPDLATQAIEERLRTEAEKSKTPAPTPEELEAAKASERLRLEPKYNSVRYAAPAYCQLADACAEEIKRGAEDESELGVFHDLFQPQRKANLRARLDEYTPAGMDVGIIQAT